MVRRIDKSAMGEQAIVVCCAWELHNLPKLWQSFLKEAYKLLEYQRYYITNPNGNTHTHIETGRIRNTFEITVRHSTHSNARMREGREGRGHSPLVSVRHMPKCLANCCHCCWRLNRRFWLFSVLSVQLTNCQAKVATHFNSIPTTQLLPRPPVCLYLSRTRPQGHSQV